ncbi:MAG: Guanine nucleotide exchange factor lte1 [Trizodia sp. TS-e1964]|nr:MAG: Guanine nucleotide exchange factor lte1 [Trizodia sp. TS-e1964]
MDDGSVSLALGTGSRSSSGSSFSYSRPHPARRRPTTTRRPLDFSSAPRLDSAAFAGIRLAPAAPRSRSAKRRTPPPDARWRDSARPLRSVHSAEGLPVSPHAHPPAYAVVPAEGSSGSREGRQFTVGSVGNNGRIYLRPVMRSAHPRPAAPAFVFPPITPPSSIDNNPTDNYQDAADASARESAWSEPRTPRPSTRAAGGASTNTTATSTPHPPSASPPIQPRKQPRAHSFSTLNEPRLRESEAGAYRVVIGRPLRRPRTADTASIPALHVRIPHYRLGSPRFSARGTAFLHDSTYTHTSTTVSTDPLRSSYFAHADLDKLFPIPPGMPHHLPPLRRKASASALAGSANVRTSGSARDFNLPTPLFPRSAVVIEPSIYDTLTFSPAADSPTVVRYSAATGEITAATPPRLIAQITSPNFLDYDLLSDFFLTFRSFLSTQHLVAYLMARLQWAMNLDDENGRIVRVRSFVALRHWVLNYFVDDFVPDFNLRLQFCEMLNAVCDSLYRRLAGPGTDLNVIGELKKCWRRTCALYWDGPEFDNGIPAHVDIHPGGVAGSRQAELALLHNPGWNGATVALPQIESVVGRELTRATDDGPLLPESSSRAKAKAKALVNPHDSGYRSRTGRQASQASDLSLQVASCSLPTRSIRTLDGSHRGPHPVECGQAASSIPLVASAPLTSKRCHTAHSHKRSGSFSDALRDNRTPLPLSKAPNANPQLLMAFPYAGSLVRGNIFPPTQVLVEVLTPGTPPGEQDPTHLHASEPINSSNKPGMKKFLGTVCRVLSNKYNGVQAAPSPEPEAPSLPFAAAKHLSLAHYVETTAIKDKDHQPSAVGGALRMDLLGLEIVQAYERAIHEADTSAHNPEPAEPESVGARKPGGLAPPSARVPSHLTGGSQSIVIVDDTQSSSFAMMSGALLADDSMMPNKAASINSKISVATARRHAHRDSRVLTRSRSTSSIGVIQSIHQNPISHRRRPSSLSFVEGGESDEKTPRLLPGATFVDAPLQGFKGATKQLQQSSLRKYSSFQDGDAQRLPTPSIDTTSICDSQSILSGISHDKPPARLLRRRPGGDLRAAQNVQELGPGLLRPKSAGSITTYTGSFSSSTFRTRTSVTVDIVDDEYPSDARAQCSLGVVSDSAVKTQISMVDTHSSQPNLRPSFEAELKKLAQIPDDDDDGGVESAMLKLEGKFEGKRLSVRSITDVMMEASMGAMPHNSLASAFQHATFNVDSEPYQTNDALNIPEHGILVSQTVEQTTSFVVQERELSLSANSQDSFSSPPLHGHDGIEVAADDFELRDGSSEVSVPLPLFGTPDPNLQNTVSAHPSMEYVQKTMSMLQIPPGSTLPEFALPRDTFFLDEPSHESFLLDEDENYSDLSSEISMEMVDPDDAVGPYTTSFFHDKDENPGASFASYPFRHPPSPPLLSDPALPNPTAFYKNQIGRRPPTPELSPVNDAPMPNTSFPPRPPVAPALPAEPAKPSEPEGKPKPLHLPFILAQNSDILAQQFTLVEKDALNEVDWKELVDLRWKQTASGVRNWVDFLKSQEPKGIEVVIARFNLMVKWATSEIILTQSMEERARCIIKYIHIAAHCRRYRNYATMYQLTIALLSQDVSRLSMTWALVSPQDMQILRQLEALVQPIRNFHNLRIEMETVSPDEGCIPFVGIYTHDLIFNSQRPSQIASTPDTDPLINFERQRTTASIVKSLLRLLEASTKYNFQPVEGVIERCLWMAALSDDEIRSRSKALK